MKFLASLLFALAAVSQAAIAQEPPTRVGRLAFTEGTVALYQDPDLGWEKAYVNSPVTSENSIWTDPDSRAEMRVSCATCSMDRPRWMRALRRVIPILAKAVPQSDIR